MAPENTFISQPPGTPTRHGFSRPNEIFDAKISLLCTTWPLGLKPKEDHSPSKSRGTIEDKCLFLMKWCHHKHVLDEAIMSFRHRAEKLYSDWVKELQVDRGVLPESTRHVPRPINEKERLELLECLVKILNEQREAHPSYKPSATPQSSRMIETRSSTKAIAFPLSRRTGTEKKRALEEPFLDIAASKKAKSQTKSVPNSMPPPPDRSRPTLPYMASSTSTNTSFTSDSSSVFSKPSFDMSTILSTQETLPEDELSLHKIQDRSPAFTTVQEDKNHSSDYGASSSFERAVLDTSFEGDIENDNESTGHIAEQLSQNLQEIWINEDAPITNEILSDPKECDFLDCLESIFPGVPLCLRSASIYVTYEITRVFLHAGVSLQDFDARISDGLKDYDILWKFLKNLPSLQDRPFPERCGAEVWKFAIEDECRGSNSVVFAGSLHFGTDSEPAFRLRLEPLKLDHSHRLGRRLGNDRFLEICMPSLLDKKLPKWISRLRLRGSKIFYDWLVDSGQFLLGRKWQPFFAKPKERKAGKKDASQDIEAEAAIRVYFFAVDGQGFSRERDIGKESAGHHAISISALLNMVRPTKENSSQSYLKLFSRTSLALSRNHDTLLLLEDQIRYQEEDILYCGEVMNDGAARISVNLANQITLKLGLSYLPSAFQARLGAAKGLWVVDSSRDIKGDWIEIYPSQQKWQRDNNIGGDGVSDDWSHRTFEVLKWSGPLKSADLNTQFLPLLVAQAINPNNMKMVLSKILEDGLANEVATLKEAFQNPQALRKWVREVKSSTVERLKYGAVPYRAGMPTSTEERINVLLDAGFSPLALKFLYEQAKAIFNGHCDDLEKRLNITVGKSTYAYMVPDFWGVLEPGEVYIDFSGFVDDVTGFSGAFLNGVDLLVARSPAHFVSDMQKVKSVVKAELMGLKDVIVFSTKGNPSLASKLSGGDYDGDIAWVCWEESIVENFETAEIPVPINLVREGFLHKDSTTYKDLVRGTSHPTSLFLKKALEFNMQQSMLGICTNFKEKVCYTQKNVDSRETRYLSQLLSDLVDAAKQGFGFDEDDFSKFKTFLNVKTIMPKYMSGDLNGPVDHILDHLMIVARNTIKKALVQFWAGFKEPAYYDEDLVLMYENAKRNATLFKEWENLLAYLRKELTALKDKWRAQSDGSPKQREKFLTEFSTIVVEYFEEFHAIRPNVDNPLTQALLLSSGVGNSEELSQWSLLKASVFFSLYSKRYVPNAVWWIAGRQLLRLKADAGRTGLPHIVAPHMYIIQKPDNSIIRRLMSDGHAAILEESSSARNVEELEELYDD